MSVLAFPYFRFGTKPAISAKAKPFYPSLTRQEAGQALSKADQESLVLLESHKYGYSLGRFLDVLNRKGRQNCWLTPLSALGMTLPLPLTVSLDILTLPFSLFGGQEDGNDGISSGQPWEPFTLTRCVAFKFLSPALRGRALNTTQVQNGLENNSVFPQVSGYYNAQIELGLLALKEQGLVIKTEGKNNLCRWHLTPQGRRLAKLWQATHSS